MDFGWVGGGSGGGVVVSKRVSCLKNACAAHYNAVQFDGKRSGGAINKGLTGPTSTGEVFNYRELPNYRTTTGKYTRHGPTVTLATLFPGTTSI